jgi:hypothetical protein
MTASSDSELAPSPIPRSGRGVEPACAACGERVASGTEHLPVVGLEPCVVQPEGTWARTHLAPEPWRAEEGRP